jgi:hypothetical protein
MVVLVGVGRVEMGAEVKGSDARCSWCALVVVLGITSEHASSFLRDGGKDE